MNLITKLFKRSTLTTVSEPQPQAPLTIGDFINYLASVEQYIKNLSIQESRAIQSSDRQYGSNSPEALSAFYKINGSRLSIESSITMAGIDTRNLERAGHTNSLAPQILHDRTNKINADITRYLERISIPEIPKTLYPNEGQQSFEQTTVRELKAF